MPNDKPQEKSWLQKLAEQYFPPAMLGKKIADTLNPPEQKPETASERRNREEAELLRKKALQKAVTGR